MDIVGTRHDANERNFIYVASEKEFDFNNLNYSGKTYSDQPIDDLSKFLIEKSQIDLKNAIVLTDDKPALEILLMRPALEWRKKLNEIFRDRLVKDKQPIYY